MRSDSNPIRVVQASMLAFFLAVSAQTKAEPTATSSARESFERGYELVQRGEFEAGIALFEQAYTLQPNYSVLYNLAQAYASAGKVVQALETFERYLEDGGAEIPEERRAYVENAIAHYRRRTGALLFEIHPASARVVLDGRDLGPGSEVKRTRVSAGNHVVRVELSGHQTLERTVEVSGGKEVSLELELEPERAMDLLVRCGTPDVTLRVDGSVLYPASEGLVLRLPATRHEYEFFRPGYYPKRSETPPRPGATEELDCTLRVDPEYRDHTKLRVRHPVGTSLRLDGAAFSAGPVPPGRHRLEVSGPGYERLQHVVVLKPREQTTLTLVPATTAEERARADQDRARARRTAAFIVGGTGVAAVSVAAVLFVLNDDAHDEWQAKNNELVARMKTDPESVTPGDLDALIEEENAIRNRDTLAVGISVAGGVLVAGAVALGLWSTESSAPTLVGRAHDWKLRLRF